MRTSWLMALAWAGVAHCANLQKTCSSNPTMDEDNAVGDGNSFTLQCSFSGGEVTTAISIFVLSVSLIFLGMYCYSLISACGPTTHQRLNSPLSLTHSWSTADTQQGPATTVAHKVLSAPPESPDRRQAVVAPSLYRSPQMKTLGTGISQPSACLRWYPPQFVFIIILNMILHYDHHHCRTTK